MTNISSINIEQSISSGRLIRKYDWVDYLDIFAFCIIASAFLFYGILTETQIPVDGLLTWFLVYFVAPFFIIASLYCIYRKICENKLSAVHTTLSKGENENILKNFLNKYGYKISRQNKDIIIVVDEYLRSLNGLWRKKYVFLITDQAIYFNIVKLYPIISPPILFSHQILRCDLKKFIAKS